MKLIWNSISPLSHLVIFCSDIKSRSATFDFLFCCLQNAIVFQCCFLFTLSTILTHLYSPYLCTPCKNAISVCLNGEPCGGPNLRVLFHAKVAIPCYSLMFFLLLFYVQHIFFFSQSYLNTRKARFIKKSIEVDTLESCR